MNTIEEKTIKEISDLVHKHFEKDFPDGLVMPIKNMKERWEREAIINYRIRFEAGVDICTKEMLERIETGKSKEKHFVSIEEAENMVKEAIEKHEDKVVKDLHDISGVQIKEREREAVEKYIRRNYKELSEQLFVETGEIINSPNGEKGKE